MLFKLLFALKCMKDQYLCIMICTGFLHQCDHCSVFGCKRMSLGSALQQSSAVKGYRYFPKNQEE